MINYIHEPTDLQCGQAVLAMVLGKSAEDMADLLRNERETTLKEMKDTFALFGVSVSSQRREATSKADLPDLCMLSLETPRCWHWSLYAGGVFYDPEHGVMDDFPECKRKYFWQLTKPRHRLTDTALEDALMHDDKPSEYLSLNRERYPQLAALTGIPQPAQHHMEGDAFTHTLMVADEAAKRRDAVRFPLGFMLAAVCHDMGKAVTTVTENGAVHALGHETEGLPIAAEFLRSAGADGHICRYVLNMTELHMEPNIMAGAGSRLKKTNRLFDRAEVPYDLIQLAVCDGLGKIPPVSYEGFLLERYDMFREIMSRPFVTVSDLKNAGIRQEKLADAAGYALKLRLAGIDRENALIQTLSQKGFK